MAGKKSATARRREGMADNTPTRALVLPLALSPDQHAMYSRLADLYNRVWGSAVSWYDSNHTVNAVAAHKALYADLRGRFPQLPSQFVCNALRDAAGAVRSWNSNHPKRGWSLRASRKRPTISFDLRTMGLRGNLLTLNSMHGLKRQRFLLPPIPAWFDERYPERRLQTVTLVLGPTDLVARLTLTFRIPKVEPAKGKVLGVDLGMHALYKDSEGGEYRYPRVQRVKRRYAYDRRTLQEKGTRSAHRRLKTMSGREERFIRDVDHCAAKRLADTPGIGVIAFEDLSRIRRLARKGTRTGRKRRNMLNQWSFSQLQEFTAYKAAAKGIKVVMVNPAYTSQRCNACGYVDKGNRDRARFDCLRCGHSDDADHNAALNIRDRALQSLGQTQDQGAVSHP
ncbi:IS200/IS605 family element transposase accessory protein TnpB [Bifidobacterium adolescentis]|nr:IS200/IS605 family element transposase accessory protein TnpB [Bifidobacterium adolescentis]KAB5994288.1 IS200/IS605 family element transposase accessory protein TnpB [Bifidobacterium adolescentis]KAB5997956.1 IS200/IS605 family element transposase accessory protein TnpB [Bifidobacterium adolescentis]KAB6009130.1 IS200/IS605 family element transposase accessory protein TnpB [Bifidobacterium adolescentis]KAB6037325.1 IS200/IS605 family element transposase accessory protein TnpB [Bifidobacteri